jgi:hypothetical protein
METDLDGRSDYPRTVAIGVAVQGGVVKPVRSVRACGKERENQVVQSLSQVVCRDNAAEVFGAEKNVRLGGDPADLLGGQQSIRELAVIKSVGHH